MPNQSEYYTKWTKEPNITEKIHGHASEFLDFYTGDANLVSMEKNTIIQNIDGIIDKLSKKIGQILL